MSPAEDLRYVLDALRLARARLAGRVPLIGFAGAPWTLMSYMVEGSGTKTFAKAKRFLVEQPRGRARAAGAAGRASSGRFLEAQVAAGRAGGAALRLLGRARWGRAISGSSRCPTWRRRCGSRSGAGAPVIAFAPGAGWALEEIADVTGADVIGVDWQTDAAEARRRLAAAAGRAPGEPRPTWLYADPAVIRERTHAMLDAFGGVGHIANLGHGILPDVPVAHAQAFVDGGEGMAAPVTDAGARERVASAIESLHDEATASSPRSTAAATFREDGGSGPAAAAA